MWSRSPNVYGTHHIGASTDQAQEAIAAETVRIVRSFKDTGKVPNVVNLALRTPATHMLVVRHRDRPGVLAHVFDHLREANLNVQETENIVFDGAEAAVARINLDGAPAASLCDKIRAAMPTCSTCRWSRSRTSLDGLRPSDSPLDIDRGELLVSRRLRRLQTC